MIAWPVDVDHSTFELTAIDKAGNVQVERLPINNKARSYRVSKLTLKKDFLQKKVASPIY